MWTHPAATSKWNHQITLVTKENVYYIVCLKKHQLTFTDFLQMLVFRGDNLKQKNILIIRIYSRQVHEQAPEGVGMTDSSC